MEYVPHEKNKEKYFNMLPELVLDFLMIHFSHKAELGNLEKNKNLVIFTETVTVSLQ